MSPKFVYLILSLFILSIGLMAEKQGSTLRGVVYDNNNLALSGAHISIPSLERGSISNEKGEFTFYNLPKGKHKIVISFAGFETLIRQIEIINDEHSEVFKLKMTSLQTDEVVITGNPYANNPLNTPQDIISINYWSKLKLENSSLGKTIESIPGIYNLSAGNVAGKPVIRGHSGERVLILNDGISLEYQQYGERHAPTIDINNFERIEIVKGAASVLYGSDAMGGVVNLISTPSRFAIGSTLDFGGKLSANYFSNNNEYMTSLSLNGASDLFAVKGNIVRRKADNFQTPDADPYSKTLRRGDPKFTGEIPHTNFEQINGSFGIGYLSPFGIVSADYNGYSSKNNFLLPDGGPIGLSLENHNVTLKSNIPLTGFVFKPKFNYQRNSRKATKAGLNFTQLPDSAAVDLLLQVVTARFDLENVNLLNLSGTLGVEVKHYDHQNLGIVALQPTGHFTNYSAYAFQEWKESKWAINLGLRFDYRNQLFLATKTNPLLTSDDERSYSTFSGSVGVSYKVTEDITTLVNIGRGFRTPSFFNLYVYGEHGGVFAFQIGNPNLTDETSLDLSWSLRLQNSFIRSSATVYLNTVNNYIFLYNAPNHPLAPAGKPFVFAHDQADAQLFGFEIDVEASITNWLLLYSNYSALQSKFLSGPWEQNELPLMPPNRLNIGSKIKLPEPGFIQNPYFSIDAKFVSDKKAVGIYEPFGQFDDGIGPDIPFGVCSTTSYETVNLGFGFETRLFKRQMILDFEVANLLGKVYRDFFDTYKGYTLAPGRSFNFRVNFIL